MVLLILCYGCMHILVGATLSEGFLFFFGDWYGFPHAGREASPILARASIAMGQGALHSIFGPGDTMTSAPPPII